jgi:2-enoate reductase
MVDRTRTDKEEKHMEFSHLAQPITIGTTLIKNRIALAPMNDLHQFYDPEEGTINRRWVDYFAERARGGVGLIITGAFKVEDEVTRFRLDGINIWALLKRKSMQNYAEMNRLAHVYGARTFIQLTAGPGRVVSGRSIDQGFQPISSSPNRAFFRPDVTCRELETAEVDRIVDAFAEAAEIVKAAEFDGIEVHGHEGYLIDQFVTAVWNRRTDKYGGDLDGRLTFPIEILKSIRRGAGRDFTVIYRYGSKHFLKGFQQGALRTGEPEIGRDLAESIEIAKKLEQAGYDGLHVDVGCYESAYWAHPPMYMPEGLSVDLTAQVKKAVGIPVIGVGRLGEPALAEKVLSEKKLDMVALGRDLLADPYWPKKVFAGRTDEIRLCIGCHECMYLAETGKYLTCAVNPFCGNEGIVELNEAKEKKRVAIIGGGAAGMEAARLLTLRGHSVTLFERDSRLGGHLIPAAKPDFKRDIKKLLRWYENQMKKLSVPIEHMAVAAADLDGLAGRFDVFIVATGSREAGIPVKATDNSRVASTIEVLNGEKEVGRRVVMVGGGVEGCETAIWLASKGKEVTIIEMLDKIARGQHRSNRQMLLDMVADLKIAVRTRTKVLEIGNKELVIVDQDLNTRSIDYDSVVIAVGMKSENGLYTELLKKGKEAYLIGDGYLPGKIIDAVWQATMLCTTL